MKTKENHFSLFYFHFNYVVELPDATVLAGINNILETVIFF